jgi:short-subunit dehydrogenase
MAVYYASKAYVLSFSEALAAEARGSGVTVTALCPGPTESDFGRRAGFSNADVTAAYGVMTAEAVARTGHRAFRRGRAVAVSGWRNRLAVFAVRWTPRALTLPMLAMAQRRRQS